MSSSGSKILLVTLLSTLAMAPACFCATGPEIRFEHIGVEHGLSDNSVYAIHQDIKGFMWFGTTDGLNRYDGYHFTIYRHIPLDSQSISINNAIRIFEDRSGTLWIRGPLGGNLNRFDRTRERFTRCLPNTLVSSIFEDAHGTLWFATPGRGLFKYDKATATFVHYSLTNDTLAAICGNPRDDDRTLFVGTVHGVVAFDQREATSAYLQGGPSGAVTAMLGDRAGNVWIGTREELCSFNCATKTCTRYPFDRQISRNPGDNDAQRLYEDREGLIWIGIAGAGIAVFDPSTRKYRHFPHAGYQTSWVNPHAICEDRAGELWIGTAGRGLQKYDRLTGSFSTYLNDPRNVHSLSGNFVNRIYEDRSGTLWIGTDAGGLSKIDPAQKSFHDYAVNLSVQKGLTNNVVEGFAEDHLGRLWITTMGGLSKFVRSAEAFTHFRNDPKDPGSLSANLPGPVLEDRGGSLWVGAGENGLDRLDPSRKRFTHYTHDPRNPRSLGSNTVFSLCEDRTGGLWVGYANNVGPLDRLDLHSGTVTHYRVNAQDSNSFWGGSVWAIYEDSQAHVWICAGGGGLDRFDSQTGSFSHYLHEPNNPFSLSAGSVRSIHEDGGGTLWVGTTAGLNKFDRARGTFVQYTVRDGLESDHIGAILLDDHGCLWMSTNRGISKFDSRTAVFRNYNEDDGVSIHPGYAKAGYRTRNGEMYFGGVNGFVRFHPDSIADNPYVPPIVITRFLISDTLARLDTVIAEKKVIGLSHDQNSFAFEFVSLNYTNSAKNQYAYKLEGFDKDWVQSGTRRYASYTNLDGGTYVFRVKGSNNDGVWNEQGASITLIITPPFSKTWWFITMVWVSIAGAGAGTVRYVEITKLRRRMRALEQQQALEKERVRISIDLHDELASNLTSIAMLSKILYDEEQRGEATLKQRPQLLERITTLSKESVHGIRDIIWAIDPKAETLASLLQRIRDMAVVACRDRNVGFTYEASGVGQLRAADLTPVERRHLWQLLKEAVHNALNHSGCKTIALVTSLQGETVSITLNDDGCGFDSSVVSGGKGLKTMRLRAQEIGSGLDIVTRPGGGTSVTIFVKGQNRLN